MRGGGRASFLSATRYRLLHERLPNTSTREAGHEDGSWMDMAWFKNGISRTNGNRPVGYDRRLLSRGGREARRDITTSSRPRNDSDSLRQLTAHLPSLIHASSSIGARGELVQDSDDQLNLDKPLQSGPSLFWYCTVHVHCTPMMMRPISPMTKPHLKWDMVWTWSNEVRTEHSFSPIEPPSLPFRM